jgi:hypothetical protein
MQVKLTIYPVENRTLYKTITATSWKGLLRLLDSAYSDHEVQAVGFDLCCEECDHVLESVHIELDRLRFVFAGG